MMHNADDWRAKAPTRPSVRTISKLISGFGRTKTANSRTAVLDPDEMAKQMRVTFRPLPRRFKDETVLRIRQQLAVELAELGVEVLDWDAATTDYFYRITIPLLGKAKSIRARLVRSDVNTVFDVERRPSLIRRLMLVVAELLYVIHTRVFRRKPKAFVHVARLVGWSWDHAVKFIHNHEKTQVVTLLRGAESLFSSDVTYDQITHSGGHLLTSTFSHIVICVSDSRLRMFNMNMADSLHSVSELRGFVRETLVPKLFVPIMPLPLGRFDISHYRPEESKYAPQLVALGNRLAATGLLPDGIALRNLFWQWSFRDLIEMLTNGRTGVSFGFVAYIEPPVYVGQKQLCEDEWNRLDAADGFDFKDVRQNAAGRLYLDIQIQGNHRYQQVPDVWLASSRSGACKTDLQLDRDIIRIGLCPDWKLQLPEGMDPSADDVNPSYDTYVMAAMGMAAALYRPELVEQGAAIVHFHGFPSPAWLTPMDGVSGTDNPSVPCGTFEAGVLGFLGIRQMSYEVGEGLEIGCVIEPDHGSNFVCGDVDHLLQRIIDGCRQDQIRMGGHHFLAIKAASAERNDVGTTTPEPHIRRQKQRSAKKSMPQMG